MYRRLIAPAVALLLALFMVPALATPQKLPGWAVYPTAHSFDALIKRVKSAAKANGMGVVTQAGPTGAAKRRGIVIPGNRVIGLFNNKYAVRMLAVSENAMIEAPVRVYITENPDGTATLSYKTPGHVFAPYATDGAEVMVMARELDAVFEAIALAAAK